MNDKAIVPFMLGILSLVVFLSPDILGWLLNTGITLSLSEFVAWAAIMLGSACGGLGYGFYVAGKELSSAGKVFVVIGMVSCLAMGIVEAGMVLFLLTGGG